MVLDKVGAAVGNLSPRYGVWFSVSVLLVYLSGYLALRVQLSTLGVFVDLVLLDERYLIAGILFVIYACTAVPFALVAVGAAWGAARMFRRVAPTWNEGIIRACARFRHPVTVTVFGLAVIQLVMRQCLSFHSVLTRDSLPGPEWFRSILLSPREVDGQLFFGLLLIIVAVCSGSAVRELRDSTGRRPRAWGMILMVLAAVQCLLLPVNYGVLRSAADMPQVELSFDSSKGLPNAKGWWLWEGDRMATYLSVSEDGSRAVVSVASDEVVRIEHTGVDSLLGLLDREGREPRPSAVSRSAMLALLGLNSTIHVRSRPDSSGDIYVCSTVRRGQKQLTTGGGFRSPVFVGDQVFALSGTTLVAVDRDAASPGPPKRLRELPDVIRLIGDTDDGELVFLAREGARLVARTADPKAPAAGLKTLGEISDDDLIADLLADSQRRDRVSVYSERGVDKGFRIMLERGQSEQAKRISFDSEPSTSVDHVQPVLSRDGRWVLYLRCE